MEVVPIFIATHHIPVNQTTMNFSTPGTPAIGAVIPGRNDATFMSYHEKGERLFVASATDNTLQVIDCLNGKAAGPPLRCEREKIQIVKATHQEDCVLFASSGSPTQPVGQRYAVNYWSIHDNKILRKFRGHSAPVTSISMCPADDLFLTSSDDRTVRLWNVGQAGCVANLELPAETEKNALAAYDSTGLVFAVTAAMTEGKGHYVHLYDARNYQDGPFAEMKVTQADLQTAIQSHVSATPDRVEELSQAEWTSIQFNVSGNQILIGAEQGLCVLLDGFEGTVQRVLTEPKETKRAAVCCFTPDDRTVLQGNQDGSISCWNVDSGTVAQTLKGHPGSVSAIAANPTHAQIASACSQTALWCW